MNAHTERVSVAGPAGAIECAIDRPEGPERGVAVLCHPHPVYGGTMDNKVVQTLARAFLPLGLRTVRFNFRGVGGSAGAWDEGRGEVDDALAVIAAHRGAAGPLVLGGFSFGAYVASQAAQRLDGGAKAQGLVLVAPAAVNFPVAPVPEDTLVIHGESDEVVPLQAALDWARPQHLPVVVVPGTGHFFHGQLALLKSLVQRAFSNLRH
jgi:alpha/beta superfamily hydrolase